MQQITTTVNNVKRLNNSINGNPNFLIYTNEGVVRTPKDSTLSYAYTFSNFIGDKVLINYYLNNKSQAILESIEKIENESIEHTSTLKHTSKGLRIWIENASFLNDCGFSVGQRYDRDYKDGFIVLTLNHPIGKYKVSNSARNGKQRPIIDIMDSAKNKISNSIDPVKYSLIKASLFSNTIDKVIIIEGVQL